MSSQPDISTDILASVIEIITRIGGAASVAADQDFYDAGVTSVMALPILLELEDRFAVSIPDDLFIAARSPNRIAQMIAGLQAR